VLRRALLVAALLALLVAGGGVAVARSTPSLSTEGPTEVSGTEASAVFQLGEHTIRQVRYDDGGTLHYTFEIANDGRLPVRVVGLAADQPGARLFTLTEITEGSVGPGDSEKFTVSMHMSGCENLSARAGSVVSEVAVLTKTAGMFEDTVVLDLPEEVHTGSPREASCPNSTATSRPPG
jgi:hypothetical protein